MGEKKRKQRAFASFEEQLRHMSTGAHDYGDAPVDERYRQQMVAMMQALNKFVNGEVPIPERETGIVVLMFRFGDGPGRANYMSNGVRREDIVTLFKEQIARFEGQPDIEGHA
jgi:hypothetical protein